MKLTVQLGEQPPISYSAYDTFTQCPKKFQLLRVIRVPETPGLYLAGGSAVHTVTAILDQLTLNGASLADAVNNALDLAEQVGLEAAQEELNR